MSKYTKVENVRILIALLKQHNIKHIVISPGGTNIPIVQGVQEDPFFHCYSVVDERSAMYFAIGLYLQLGVPIATSCTSAQATRNYVPGLTEAFYKHVPILAITTSKHARYTHQEIMQAPNQVSLPEDCVKRSFPLPYIACGADRLICERMINEAILELTHKVEGPVQLNIPVIDSERLSFEDTELPKVRTIRRFPQGKEWNVSLKNRKIMVVVGEHICFPSETRALLERFVENHNAFVYTNHLSNLHAENEIQGNLLLSAMSQALFDEQFAPDVLITIGGQTGDYPLFGKLSSNRFLEHWRVSPEGDVVDTYDKLTIVFECGYDYFFEQMSNREASMDHSYLDCWQKALVGLNMVDVELPLSNIYVAQQLHRLIPEKSSMTFAILNSLRSWSFFPLDKSINCYSPVGAFGIDGGMSMAFGQAYTSDKLSFFVTGDLAFFYDMNSLGIRGLRNNIRIILVNNNGGAEFQLYGNPNKIDLITNISASDNNSSAEGWARANNFEYMKVITKRDLDDVKQAFVSENDKSIVLEVMTSSDAEGAALSSLISSNFIGTSAEIRKNKLKSFLSDSVIGLLRGFMD